MNQYQQAAMRLEQIPPGEADQITEIADLIVKLLDQRYATGPRVLRAVHPKAHACVQATFEVDPEICEHLRIGLFACPGATYDAVIRFSNAAAILGPDVVETSPGDKATRQHGSRGMAIKIRGVPGSSFLSDDELGTQDFLMVNAPVFPFANVSDYLALTRAQLATKDDPRQFFPAFAAAVSGTEGGPARVARTFEITKLIQRTSMGSPLESTYFTAAPFLFGLDHVAKFAAVPVDAANTGVPDILSDAYLRDVLVKQIGERSAAFDLCVQTREPTDDLAVEDVTVEWNSQAVPLQKLGRLSIPRQEVGSTDACEQLFFTPWHSLPEFMPLGGINRLRKAAYLASFQRRSACYSGPTKQPVVGTHQH